MWLRNKSQVIKETTVHLGLGVNLEYYEVDSFAEKEMHIYSVH